MKHPARTSSSTHDRGVAGTLVLALAVALMALLPACGSRVVVGRSAPAPEAVVKPVRPAASTPEKKEPPKPQPEAAPKPAPSQKQPDGAKDVTAPKPESKAAPGAPAPSASPAKPDTKPEARTALAQAEPSNKGDDTKSSPPPPDERSSPARPRPVPDKTEEATPSSPPPYKLDLSFGGFGLGVGLLDTPVGVAVDDQENIYVVDQGNNRIQKFDRYGIFQFAWGRQGMGDGEFVVENSGKKQTLRMTGEFEFNKPIGILLDKDDLRNLIRITVVDSLNYRIQRFLLTQERIDRFPDDVFKMLPKGGIEIPDPALKAKFEKENRQVILDPVYLSSAPNKADNFLLAPFRWGGLGFTEGQLNLPTYLAIGNDNLLYVADTGNARVQGFHVAPENPSLDATFFRAWGNDLSAQYGAGRLNEPTSIAFDNSGFGGFLVLDKQKGGGYSLHRFDREGKFMESIAQSGDKNGQFKQPVCVAVNPFDNTIFVTDKARRKVMVFNSKGEFAFEFGGEELADPRGIAVLRNNYVYVADAAKNMVYRYIPQ